MAFDGKLLARAREELEKIHEQNVREHQRRLFEVYNKIPAVEDIDARMRAQMSQLVRITIAGGPDVENKIKCLESENLDLQMKRSELLVENGYAMDYTNDIYSCSKCKDTGVFRSGVCSCLEKLYNSEVTKELGVLLRTGTESFENFNLNYYDAVPLPGSNIAPRSVISVALDKCRRFAEDFPDTASNLLLRGETGLGKTYLSACIARAISSKGYSVCYDSAASALEAFELQKFSHDPQEADAAASKVKKMLDCDLMILDDLGTEMINSITTSALYTLINTRLINDKRTIISTNLTMDDLQKKYTPQIYSRISGEFTVLPFIGRDIRMLKKKN